MLKFFDGFDAYATAQIVQRWTAQSGDAVIVGSGRNGGNRMVIGDSNGFCSKNYGGTNPKCIVGWAYSWGSFGTGRMLASVMEGATSHVDLRVDAAGHLFVTRNGTTLATATAALSTGVWYYIELLAVISDTVGEIQVRVNSVDVIAHTGSLDTRNGGTGYADTVKFGQNGVGTDPAGSIDDVYICDGSGGIRDTFLGDVRCEVLVSSGAGAHTDWTPSTGSNYQNVDEKPATGDTDYNSSSTAAQKDTFAFGDLAEGSADILGVQHLLYTRKDDAGSRTMHALARIGGTDYAAADFAVTDSYAYTATIAVQSPATSADWTVSEINAAEFGYELVS